MQLYNQECVRLKPSGRRPSDLHFFPESEHFRRPEVKKNLLSFNISGVLLVDYSMCASTLFCVYIYAICVYIYAILCVHL